MGLTPPENTSSSRHEDELIDVDTVDSSSTPLLPTPKKKENKTKYVQCMDDYFSTRYASGSVFMLIHLDTISSQIFMFLHYSLVSFYC